jgi:hypothetical protein
MDLNEDLIGLLWMEMLKEEKEWEEREEMEEEDY